jgi:glucosyl-dolichyl phosphate glucuronosyltransferase
MLTPASQLAVMRTKFGIEMPKSVLTNTRNHIPMSEPVISVVVATYNRVADLRVGLESLTKQRQAGNYEIIVVDNNSTDATAAVVAEFHQRDPHIRYVFEPQPGASQARNRGWQEARGTYVAYLDDDCKVTPQWLSVAQDVVVQQAPAVFGGPYFAFYNTPKPRWFKDAYGTHSKGGVARALRADEYLSGGNMALRRDLLEQIGGFDPTFGPHGHVMAYGEETVLQQRIRLLPNTTIYYEPRLFVFHRVATRKWNWRWIIRERFVKGRDVARFTPSKPQNGLWLMIKAMLIIIMLFGDLVWSVFGRNRQRYPYTQNYIFERAVYNVTRLGNLYMRYQQRHGTSMLQS